MKKKFFAIFAAATVGLCALFGACSCGNDTLAFDNNVKPTETLTYKVEYFADYENNKKEEKLDGIFTTVYSNGVYTTEFKQANKSEVKSDILDIKDAKDEPLVDTVYMLTTDFSVDLTLTIGDKTYDHNEKITTKTYFAQAGVSFAPLYAKTESEYVIISVNGDTANAIIVKTLSETFYDKSEYRTLKTSKTFNIDTAAENITLENETAQESKQGYTFRSVIDNTELLFVLRGVSIAEKASTNVSVVSTEYERPTSLGITNAATSEDEITLTYNGAEVKDTVKYNSMNFLVNSTNTAGLTQYLNVQSEGSEKIPYSALILKYVKPLTTYGSFSKMGALVFTLTDVTVS